jgi:hypothetical protein
MGVWFDATHYLTATGSFGQLKTDRLSPLPQKPPPNLPERAAFIIDSQKVIARKLPDAAREARIAVRHQKLRFAETWWVPEDLSWRRVARGVLVTDTQIVVGEWYPSGLTAPARLDELPFKRKSRLKRGRSPWRAFGFEPRGERHRTYSYG